MWAPLAAELNIPWRAAEAQHWALGEAEMARRAGVVPFSQTAGDVGVQSSSGVQYGLATPSGRTRAQLAPAIGVPAGQGHMGGGHAPAAAAGAPGAGAARPREGQGLAPVPAANPAPASLAPIREDLGGVRSPSALGSVPLPSLAELERSVLAYDDSHLGHGRGNGGEGGSLPTTNGPASTTAATRRRGSSQRG
jgi:hypothetical protein